MENNPENQEEQKSAFILSKELMNSKEPKILLIGKMQSGKTTLITKLCDSNDPDYSQVVASCSVGDGYHACTKGVNFYKCNLRNTKQKVIFIDT